MNKARITYRFNANGDREKESFRKEEQSKIIPLKEEEFRVVEEKKESQQEKDQTVSESNDDSQLNYFTADFGGWSSPFDAETQRIEDLIRQSGVNSPDKKETEREEYTNPSEDSRYDAQTGYFETERHNGQGPYWDGPDLVGSRYVRHSRPSWVKIFVSVAGAAVTGILLGFFVLSMFSGADSTADIKSADGNHNLPSEKSAPTDVQTDGDPAGSAGDTAAVPAAAGTETDAVIPSRTYVLLQHGSFSGKQGAEQDQADLGKKGIPAAIELTDNKYNVYLGLVPDRDHALSISRKLQEEKVDIYAKQLSLPGGSRMRWNGSAESLTNYLDHSEKLVQTLSKLSLLHLEEAKPTSIDDPTMQALGTAHSEWAQTASTVAQGLGDDMNQLITKMNNAMNSAKTSIDEYKKNPSQSLLWQTQSFLLQFVLAEKELLAKIVVNS